MSPDSCVTNSIITDHMTVKTKEAKCEKKIDLVIHSWVLRKFNLASLLIQNILQGN
jgi:hypothetical protein